MPGAVVTAQADSAPAYGWSEEALARQAFSMPLQLAGRIEMPLPKTIWPAPGWPRESCQ